MFSDDIGLYMHLGPGPEMAQVRAAQSVLDQRDLDAPWLQVVDGEAHAIDCDGPMQNEERLERTGNREIDENDGTIALNRHYRAPENDVTFTDISATS